MEKGDRALSAMTRTRLSIYLTATLVLLLLSLRFSQLFIHNVQCCGLPYADNLVLSIQEMVGLIHFYSQSDQDRWVLGAVFPRVKDGYFVDIGSYDGIIGSNTKALEDRGWKGICIDPFPKNMKGRTCTVYKDVVYSRPGQKVLFRAAGPFGGIQERLGRWKEDIQKAKIAAVELKTTTLNEILVRARSPKFIHYISLDIEGTELEALKGFDFSKYKVGAFTIEHNYEEPKRTKIKELLEGNGYKLARSVDQDDYYVPR
jgi:FkbM family methyltransferase